LANEGERVKTMMLRILLDFRTIADDGGGCFDGHTIRQYCDRGAILADGRLYLFDDLASAFESYRRMLAEPPL
jgi:hypothetical protein